MADISPRVCSLYNRFTDFVGFVRAQRVKFHNVLRRLCIAIARLDSRDSRSIAMCCVFGHEDSSVPVHVIDSEIGKSLI
jgi:hypothetical protein